MDCDQLDQIHSCVRLWHSGCCWATPQPECRIAPRQEPRLCTSTLERCSLEDFRSHPCSHSAQKVLFDSISWGCALKTFPVQLVLLLSPSAFSNCHCFCFSSACHAETIAAQEAANVSQHTLKAHAFLLADATCWCLQQRLTVFSYPSSAGQFSCPQQRLMVSPVQ